MLGFRTADDPPRGGGATFTLPRDLDNCASSVKVGSRPCLSIAALAVGVFQHRRPLERYTKPSATEMIGHTRLGVEWSGGELLLSRCWTPAKTAVPVIEGDEHRGVVCERRGDHEKVEYLVRGEEVVERSRREPFWYAVCTASPEVAVRPH